MCTSKKGALALVAAVTLAVTLPAQDIIKYIKVMISFVMSGLVVCAFMGKYWPRATWQGGIAAIIAGGGCTVAVKAAESVDQFWGGAAIPSLACATVAGVLLSLLTPANTVSDEQALEILTSERQSMEITAESVIKKTD